MRLKKKYSNGQKRGGTSPNATDTCQLGGRAPKDYYRQAVAFHGGDMAFEKWRKDGMKGYGRKE